ncbi:MAG: protein kinase domain-containing protein, partial [Bryobacteraceae bacterium]
LDQGLKFAAQIADALDRAHRAGVTHRDVKPQNIMLTRDGVKVLDFGLAKSQAKPGPNDETLTAVPTTEGTIMGTPQYMAPEQFAGKEADARSDIWAFGSVLYEMVTGRKAFGGTNYQSLLGAILATEPAPMEAPAWVNRLVRRCLAKDPDDRWQTMRDIVIELRSPPEEPVHPLPDGRISAMGWIAGVFALVAITAGIGWYNAPRPAQPRPLLRLALDIDPGTPLARVQAGIAIGANMLALSPDGARVVLTLRGADGKVRLHTRLLNQSQVVTLAGTENAHGPFFSPDGGWIGFFADGKTKKIAVEGGAAVTLCDAPLGYGGSWGDDGNIIAALDFRTVLARIPAGGGKPEPVTKMAAGEDTHRWPQVLPGSQIVLFTAATASTFSYDDANIDMISLRTGERTTLHRGGFFGRYLADTTGSNGIGHLVYLHQSTAFAIPFHPGKLALAGAPAPILEDVGSTPSGGGDFAFAQNGTFAYLDRKPSQAGWPISWVDSAGKTAQPLHAPLGQYYSPRFSPDGKRLAFSISDGKGSDIWVKELDADTPSRLSFLPGGNTQLVWTPDGKSIVFRSSNPAAPGLYAIRSDGSGEAKRLTDGKAPAYPHSFTPDGKHLAISQTGDGGSQDIFTVPVEADSGPGGPGLRLGQAELFVGRPFIESFPAFSPDGRWLAYQSQESGTAEVYVRPFPGPGGRRQVSTGGGGAPVWSRDGRELLFLNADRHVMAAGYTTKGDSFVVRKPRVLAGLPIRVAGYARHFDIALDGKRLAAIVDDSQRDKLPTHLTFLLNFFDELRRKAPVN